MKNNLDYYIRYTTAHQHLKFKMLRSKFGWEGDGRFWALNDMIASSDNCLLDFNKPYLEGAIASELGMQLDEFRVFFSFLVDECNLVQEPETGKFTTEIVQEIFQKVEADRIAARDRKTKKIQVLESSANFPEVRQTFEKFGQTEQESKVKESKVKESISKEEKVISSCEDPTLKEVISYFESNGFSKTDAQNFYSHYSSQNWETSGLYPKSIKANWRNKVIQWMNNQKQYNNNSKTTPKFTATEEKYYDQNKRKNNDLEFKKTFIQNEKKIADQGLYNPLADPELQKLIGTKKALTEKPVTKTKSIDKNSPEYKRKLSLMNLDIDKEIRKGA